MLVNVRAGIPAASFGSTSRAGGTVGPCIITRGHTVSPEAFRGSGGG